MSRRFAEGLSVMSGAQRMHFQSESDARQFLKQFVKGPGNRTALVQSFQQSGPLTGARMKDEDLLRGLAQRIVMGELVVVTMRGSDIASRRYRPVHPTPRDSSPPPPPPPESSPPPPPAPAQENLVPNPVAQAAALENAADSGAPLCET